MCENCGPPDPKILENLQAFNTANEVHSFGE